MLRKLSLVAALLCATFSRVDASTVTDTTRAQTVVVTNTRGTLAAIGAGVIVANDHGSITILSALHPTLFGGALTVTLADGQTLSVLSSQPVAGHDLALLTIGVPHGIIHTASPAAVVVGEALHVWGHVRGAAYTLSLATLQDLHPPSHDDPHVGEFAIDCSTCGVGDSGSGVFDASGHLVGIVTGGLTDNSGQIKMTIAESVDFVFQQIRGVGLVTSGSR